MKKDSDTLTKTEADLHRKKIKRIQIIKKKD